MPIEGFEILDFDSDSEDEYADDSSSDEGPNRDPTKSKYPLETMVKICHLLDSGKTYLHLYTKLKNNKEIIRIREYVDQGGTKFQKLIEIDEYVLNMFKDARSNNEIIHDFDLVAAALRKAREIGDEKFKATNHWLHIFKSRHRIFSRQITKLVGPNFTENEELFEERARKSLEMSNKFIENENILDEMICNGDHTGINFELTGFRTLAIQGSKQVVSSVQRIWSTTHSFTLYPVINRAGQLFSTFFVVFYEPKPPAKFADELAEFERLVCVNSTSGKMTTNLQGDWFANTFIPGVPRGTLMFLDSWSGYKRVIESDVVQDNLRILVIPERTTSKVQPLDRFWNRQFKLYLRIIHERIRRDFPDFILSKRKNIARILNEIHYQFSSPIFIPFVKYSWKSAGLLNAELTHFDTPPQFCFRKCNVQQDYLECGAIPFLKCAWCSLNLCFQHFLLFPHRCH